MFSERLRMAREKSNKSQDVVAEYLNVKRQTYSAYERGISTPDPDSVAKLSKLFNVTTDYLLELTDDPRPQSEAGSSTSGIALEDMILNNSELSEESKQIMLQQLRLVKILDNAKTANEAAEEFIPELN